MSNQNTPGQEMSPEELKALLGGGKPASASGGGQQYNNRNIALKVASIDPDNPPAEAGRFRAGSVTGVDMESGEQMTIRLRELKRPNDKAANPTMWANSSRKNTAYVVAGGVILFENVYQRDPLDAQYGTALSYDPDDSDRRSDVNQRYLSISTTKGGAVSVNVVLTDESKVARSADELFRFVEEGVNARNGVMVRAAAQNTVGEHWHIFRGGKKNADGKYETESTQAVVDRFKAIPEVAAMAAHLDAGKPFIAEIVPVQRLYYGKDTMQKVSGNAAKQGRDVASHATRSYAVEGGAFPTFGYTLSHIATKPHPNGGDPFISAEIVPTLGRPVLVRLADVPTANVKPVATPLIAKGLASGNSEQQENAADEGPAVEDDAPAPPSRRMAP